MLFFGYFDQINLLLQQYLCHCVQNLSERNLDHQKKWQEIKKYLGVLNTLRSLIQGEL